MNKAITICLGIVGLSMVLLLGSCYNQIQLTGGPKDEQAPVLDTTLSTANRQVRFEKQKINLYFDEFVTVKDAQKQILVTPPLIYTPKIEERLERVTFEFGEEEVLKENVTYIINFGESIVDYNESNKLENFTMVFSTGDYIDSLSIRGNVIDSKTKEPSVEYLVMLYESTNDSIVYQEKPFYFARTDDNGQFEINNLRADTFKLFILNDKNVNYLYDYGEEIGFIDSLLYLTDSSSYDLALESFLEQSEARYVGYESVLQGQMRLEFDQAPDLDSMMVISDNIDYKFSLSSNKYVDIWYRPANITTLNVAYRDDTIKTRISLRALESLDDNITLTLGSPTEQIGLHPSEQIILKANYPIDSFNTEFISIIDTSSQESLIYDIRPVKDEAMQVTINADFKTDQYLELTLHPGAIRDIWGHSHDTTVQNIVIANPEDFGTMELSFTSIDSSVANYFVSVMDDGDKIIETYNVNTDTTVTISKLYPGLYKLEVIEDLNNNGQWDSGNYLKKVQSERFFEVPLDDVRGNWTLEKEIGLKNLGSNGVNELNSSSDSDESTESDEPK